MNDLIQHKGVPAPFVQRIAGHSSLAVTHGYAHLEDENLVSAINTFTRLAAN